MSDTPTVYTDDTDPVIVWPVTGNDVAALEFTPIVAIDGGDYTIDATWLGDPAPTRDLRVPLTGLTPGIHTAYLQVPGGRDMQLGRVSVRDRR